MKRFTWCLVYHRCVIILNTIDNSQRNWNSLLNYGIPSYAINGTSTECLKKSRHFWIVCQMKNVKHLGEMFICMDGYRSHLLWHQKSQNNLFFGEHWPLLLRLWKLGCARIGCPFWLTEKSPSVEIDDGMVNLWLVMMDMGLCCEKRVPILPPPTQPLSTPPYPTTCTKTSLITPSNTDTITNTTSGNAIKTSTSHLWLKMSYILTYS